MSVLDFESSWNAVNLEAFAWIIYEITQCQSFGWIVMKINSKLHLQAKPGIYVSENYKFNLETECNSLTISCHWMCQCLLHNALLGMKYVQ